VPHGLSWQDHAVVVLYLAGMLVLGAALSRRQRSEREFFLAGRRMPWLAVGVSIIASLLSSLTYLSEPGEVFNSGITHVLGKLLAVPLEVVLVWAVCIPFLMRFRFTSAYEYLEHRFGYATRLVGVALFIAMVVLWMGFVVLASSRALAAVTQMPLWVIVFTLGLVATIYTAMGGLRAVVWTDVVQVALLVGGGLFAIGYIAVATGTWIPDWYAAATHHLVDPAVREAALAAGEAPPAAITLFSTSPFERATIVTVAVSMCVWHICTHTANQMTVQRYFSTSDLRAARRSFLTGSLLGVLLNVMLVVVGLAVLYYYSLPDHPLAAEGLDVAKRGDRDLVFPAFAVHHLPNGLGGAVLAALLAAAMSSIDSGINSIATVVSMELRRREQHRGSPRAEQIESSPPRDMPLQPAAGSLGESGDHVRRARWITLVAGLFITAAAYGLDYIPGDMGIVATMPRTFNAVTAPLGGIFLVGMLVPWARQRGVLIGAALGLGTSLAIGYFHNIADGLLALGWLDASAWRQAGLLNEQGHARAISFTWVMPLSLAVTVCSAALLSLFDRSPPRNLAGLTWSTRHARNPDLEDSLA